MSFCKDNTHPEKQTLLKGINEAQRSKATCVKLWWWSRDLSPIPPTLHSLFCTDCVLCWAKQRPVFKLWSHSTCAERVPRSNPLIWNPQWKAGKQSLLLLLLRRQTIHQGNHWRHSKDSQDLSAWVATVCIYFCRNTSLSTPRRRWQSQAHPSRELSVCSLPNSQAHTVPRSKKAAKIKAYLKRDLTFSGVSKKLTDSFKVKATLTQRRNGVWGIVLLNHSVCLWYD